MWVDAYDRVVLWAWNSDYVSFNCVCGKEKLFACTGEGRVECECGRSYRQYTCFEMEEPVSTELEQYLIRLRAATDAFDKSVSAFKEAGESLEKRLNERKGCDCGCS